MEIKLYRQALQRLFGQISYNKQPSKAERGTFVSTYRRELRRVRGETEKPVRRLLALWKMVAVDLEVNDLKWLLKSCPYY